MKFVKWLGGTVLALLALVVGVGAYRSLTALPAPPPMIEEGTLTFAEGVEGTYEAGDLKVVLGGEHGIEVFNKGEEVFKGPKGAPFAWAAGGSASRINAKGPVTFVGAQDALMPEFKIGVSCPDVVVKDTQIHNWGVRVDFVFDCNKGHVRMGMMELFWRWMSGKYYGGSAYSLYVRNIQRGVVLKLESRVMARDLTEEERSYLWDAEDQGPAPIIALIGHRSPDSPVFGGGEQFSHAALDGHFVPLITAEQGVGRGDKPISTLINLVAPGASGNSFSTYAPMGTFIGKNKGYSLAGLSCNFEVDECEDERVFYSSLFSAFDLREPDRFFIWSYNYAASFILHKGETPLELVEKMTSDRRMRPLPNWIGEGAILGIQGGTDVVRAKVKAAQEAGVPVVGVWLQDWQGQRRIDNSDRLWWNWVLNRERYPAWEELVADLKADGIQVMTYINPYLVDVAEELPGRRNLYAEAMEKGRLAGKYYFYDLEDGPAEIVSGSIKAGVVNLFEREDAEWYAGIITENLIGTGAMGFMADFGEAFPVSLAERWPDSLMVAMHNVYPNAWAGTVRQAIDAAPHGDQIVAFHRSGHTDSPRYATAFWAGDQLVNWGQHDGFKSAITAMMTGGISGMAYNHTDIGGYTTVVTPLTNIRRSKELFQRWAEFAAFTPIFRTHEGNQPAMNHQFDSDAETLQHFGKMAKLFQCLHPYRQRLMAEHTATGAPLMRHPWLHYPDDERFHSMTYQQMMLGADIMVVPVSDPGKTHVSAYLPDDGPNEKWEHFWTGKVYAKGDHAVPAPLGEPAFFVRPDSAVKRELAACGL